MSDTVRILLLITIVGIPLFFIVWSFASNPSAFIKAISVRIQFYAAKTYILIKFGGVITATILYVIFDPIMIIVDDILVVWAATYYIKRSTFKIIGNAILADYPFPIPWSSDRE